MIAHEMSTMTDNTVNADMEWEEVQNYCNSRCSYIESQELEYTQTSTESSTPGDDGFFEDP